MKVFLLLTFSFMLGQQSLLAQSPATSTPGQAQAARPSSRQPSQPQDNRFYQLGDKTIVIPPPEGFEEAASQLSFIKDYYTTTEAPQNDMLAVFLPTDAIEKLKRHEKNNLTGAAKVSILKKVRGTDVSTEEFAATVSAFEKYGGKMLDINGPEMKALLKRAQKGVSDITREEVQIDLSQPINLGPFERTSKVYSTMLMVRTKAELNGNQEEHLEFIGMSLVLVKQRLLYVYTHKIFTSPDEMEGHKDFTRRWIRQIIAANQE
ncbi:MAG TPA: hypothetical protein VGO91_11120 [Pyrinomonadaceae bacterium]|jgi:hypothetical protein|nr:hypothetical protein [Pyrinomonadaceae bacterium]